jgi:hypothetical protein
LDTDRSQAVTISVVFTDGPSASGDMTEPPPISYRMHTPEGEQPIAHRSRAADSNWRNGACMTQTVRREHSQDRHVTYVKVADLLKDERLVADNIPHELAQGLFKPARPLLRAGMLHF